jgi:DME family drug/metabolite transporter
MRRHTAGSLLIAGCALSWGLVAVVVREIHLPAMTIVGGRCALSAALIAGALALWGRRDLLRPPPPAVYGLGLMIAAHWSLYFAAIKQTSVASAVLITYAAPIFMALLAPVLIREHVPARSVAALAVSMAGIAAISLAGGSGNEAVRATGVVLAFLAAVTYALIIVLIKRWASDVHPMTFVAWQEATAAIALSPALALASWGALDGRQVAYLLLLGVVLTGVAGVLYVAALRWVPATTAGILAYMEPVSAAVLAAVVLGQHLTVPVILGGLAIVAAGVAVAAKAPEPAPPVEEPLPFRPTPEPLESAAPRT